MRLSVVLALGLLSGPVFAVQPGEVLDDPALEARARDISAGLRCPVCRNESIDESNAGVSEDLRRLVRERLLAGDSNDEVVEFIVDRYGEYVLLEPTRGGINAVLWWAGPGLLVLAGLGAVVYLRGRSKAATPDALSSEEEARIAQILDE
ncbi:cytochrome c-type biogenesis protein [Aliiroseovarius sp. PTFE2010]|uniref:cytochrome c-type biogenesis protein n=1 Tax=Aliiroseovarius sp. PTFE2010 TaxID=3417190 RepID=UPI003CF6AC47